MRKFFEDICFDTSIIFIIWIPWYAIIKGDMHSAAFFCKATFVALVCYLALRFTRKEEEYDG